MQNTQEINWWLEIARIGTPSIVALVVPFIAGYWLSRKIEAYKQEMSKDLENHKIQLQMDFQTKFYEFQTRYSLFHQGKADALSGLYGILIDLGTIIERTFYKDGAERKTAVDDAITKHHGYIDFYLKNQIYFNDDLCKDIEEIRDVISAMTDRYVVSDIYTKDSKDDSSLLPFKAKAGLEELEAHKKFRAEFPKLRLKLRDEFRRILSVEELSDYKDKVNK